MVKNSQKQSKDSQNSKHDHWCTNCHILPRLYQQCTNRQKQPKVSQNRKHDRPLVYQFSQVYQDSTNRLPTMYQKTVKRQLKQQKKTLVYQSSYVYTESAEYTKLLAVLWLAVWRHGTRTVLCFIDFMLSTVVLSARMLLSDYDRLTCNGQRVYKNSTAAFSRVKRRIVLRTATFCPW